MMMYHGYYYDDAEQFGQQTHHASAPVERRSDRAYRRSDSADVVAEITHSERQLMLQQREHEYYRKQSQKQQKQTKPKQQTKPKPKTNPKKAATKPNTEWQLWSTSQAQPSSVSRVPPLGSFSFDVEPINTAAILSPDRLGTFRGIQGENNSCYVDAALMAMFCASDTFDGDVLLPAVALSTQNDTSADGCLLYVRSYLTTHIVNALRTRGYVPSAMMLEWRRMIDPYFGQGNNNFDGACEHHEACEFARFLLERCTAHGGENGNHTESTDSSATFVLKRAVPDKQDGGTDDQQSTKSNVEPPNENKSSSNIQEPKKDGQVVRILAMARVKKNNRTNNNKTKQKKKTDKAATASQRATPPPPPPEWQTKEIMLQLLPPMVDASTPSSSNAQGPTIITSSRELLRSFLHQEGLCFDRTGTSLILQLPRYGSGVRLTGPVVPSPRLGVRWRDGSAVRYDLRSVIVIGSAHYVTYLRINPPNGGSSPRWVYFDSMSDRENEENIPVMRDVTDELWVLENQAS